MPKKQIISKEEIKQAALRAIETDGFEKFSMRSLSKYSGTAASTMYLYYKDKAALLFELADDFWKECFSGLVKTNDKQEFFERLRFDYFHIKGYLENFMSAFIKGFAIAGLSGRKHGTGQMEQYLQRILLRITALLRENIDCFDETFLQQIGLENMSIFIFENFKQMLLSQVSDYGVFETILKKILLRR